MAYDPSEARDEKGQWTVGSAGVDAHHSEGPFMHVSDTINAEKANGVARKAAAVAKDLGYDPKYINVSDESKTFELNGKTLPYAGSAWLPPAPAAGTITLYTPHVDDASVAGVTAHEIAHQKLEALFNDSKDEYERLQKDPDYHKEDRWVPAPGGFDVTGSHAVDFSGKPVVREPGFMRPDGLLNEPYASRYPVYQAFTTVMMPGTDKFAKTDGVSDYSREWWQAYTEGKANHLQAFHETIAEIARLKYGKQDVKHIIPKQINYGGEKVTIKKLKSLSPDWNKLYKLADTNWKRRNK